MTRQVLEAQAEIEIAGDAWMTNIEAGLPEVALHRVVGPAPLPVTDQA
jgi:hypothetical protein